MRSTQLVSMQVIGFGAAPYSVFGIRHAVDFYDKGSDTPTTTNQVTTDWIVVLFYGWNMFVLGL